MLVSLGASHANANEEVQESNDGAVVQWDISSARSFSYPHMQCHNRQASQPFAVHRSNLSRWCSIGENARRSTPTYQSISSRRCASSHLPPRCMALTMSVLLYDVVDQSLYRAEFNCWVQLDEVTYRNLPQAARIIFKLFSKNNHPAGWCGMPLFGFDHSLRTGVLKLRLWPNDCPTPNATSLEVFIIR